MDQKPSLPPAVAAAGFLSAAGLAAISLHPTLSSLGPGIAIGADLPSLAASLGANILANGIYAMCRLHPFRHKWQRAEALLNHDVEKMIQKSLGEAAHQAIGDYVAHASPSQSLAGRIFGPEDAESDLVAAVRRLKQADFENVQLDSSLIAEGIERARRDILSTGPKPPDGAAPVREEPSPEDHTAQAKAAAEEANLLSHALTNYVLDVVRFNLPDQVPVPAQFVRWLDGTEERSQGGLLQTFQRCIALYLKTDPKVHATILHATLQNIVDTQAKFAESQAALHLICESILTNDSRVEERVNQFACRVEASCRETEAAVRQLLNAAARPDLKEPFAVSVPADSLDALRSLARTSQLVGGDEALDALQNFLGAPGPLLWTVVSGEAGTGKTRLAAELIALIRGTSPGGDPAIPGGWRAGFYAGADWLQVAGHKWTPETDILIVLDYAAKYVDALADLLDHLKSRAGAENWTSRARFLLIDRPAPDSEQGLATRLTKGTDAAVRLNPCRWKADEIRLQPLRERFALQVARAYAGAKWENAHGRRIQQEIQRDPELARPLFAALLGHAISIDRLPPGSLNPVTVARIALDHQFSQKYWDPARDRRVDDLLAVVTAANGVPVEVFDTPEFLQEVCGGEITERDCGALWDSFHALCRCEEGRVVPLQPDFLGELFVLSRLFAWRGLRLKKAAAWMECAWRHGSSPSEFVVHLASDFAGRAAQLATSFPDLCPSPEVPGEVLAVILRSLLKPEALPQASPRDPGLVVLHLVNAGALEFAGQFLQQLEEATPPPYVVATAWFAYGLTAELSTREPFRANLSLQKISKLHSENSQDADVRERLASALFNRANDLARSGDLDGAGKLAEELRGLQQRFPEDAAVREQLANALVNRAYHLPGSGDLDGAGKLVEELRGLQQRFPEDAAVRERLAKALVNRAYDLAGSADLDGAGKLVEELRGFQQRFPEDAAVREQLAKALFNRAYHLAGSGDLVGVGKQVEDLRGLQQRFPEDAAVRERLAKALVNRAYHLARSGDLDGAAKLVEELRGLQQLPEDAAVRARLAKALSILPRDEG